MEMSENTKLEVAVEIISAKIADMSKNGFNETNVEMQVLLEERKKMYQGDSKIIDKIINVYGPEIKKKYEEVEG